MEVGGSVERGGRPCGRALEKTENQDVVGSRGDHNAEGVILPTARTTDKRVEIVTADEGLRLAGIRVTH